MTRNEDHELMGRIMAQDKMSSAKERADVIDACRMYVASSPPPSLPPAPCAPTAATNSLNRFIDQRGPHRDKHLVGLEGGLQLRSGEVVVHCFDIPLGLELVGFVGHPWSVVV